MFTLESGRGRNIVTACKSCRIKHFLTKAAMSNFYLSKAATYLYKQARKSSEDAQAARYSRFEKVWAG